MKACEKMDKARERNHIYLIRKEKLGTTRNKGYQIFEEIFSGKKNSYIKPDLESVQHLETYHRLVNAAAGGELVVNGKTPNVKELQALVRESGVLSTCRLLQQLGIVQSKDGVVIMPQIVSLKPAKNSKKMPPIKPPLQPNIAAAERYILNLMTTQSLMGMQVLVDSTQEQVPALDSANIVSVIHSLCDTNKIQMLDPNAKPKDQLLCYVPA